jgi:hypothetical protein
MRATLKRGVRKRDMSSMDPEEDLAYRKALLKYSASFMSNAKWLSLFQAVIRANVEIQRAEWRFLDSSHSVWVSFPSEGDLLPTRFADGKFQPFEYRWLESVYIPNSYRPVRDVGYVRRQDTESVVRVLANAGQFPIEVSADGITIRAYRRDSAT